MTSAPVLAIPAELRLLLTQIDLMDDPDRRAKRWAGVTALVAQLTPELVEALVRISSHSKHPASPQSVSVIRKAFADADADGFMAFGNDNELEVLSAITLGAVLKDGSEMATITALSVLTTSLGKVQRFGASIDLRGLAENALNRISTAQRQRSLFSVAPPKAKLSFAAGAQAMETLNAESVKQIFSSAEKSLQTPFNDVLNRIAEVSSYFRNIVEIQDEELQMLWWLIGQRSFDLGLAFSDVSKDLRSLLYAKELSDATTRLPGPVSIRALFSRAGLEDEELIRVSDAINAGPTEWLRGLLPANPPSPVIHPLHFGISRQLETGQGEAWIAGWAAATDIEQALTMSSVELATQFYRERLLLR